MLTVSPCGPNMKYALTHESSSHVYPDSQDKIASVHEERGSQCLLGFRFTFLGSRNDRLCKIGPKKFLMLCLGIPSHCTYIARAHFQDNLRCLGRSRAKIHFSTGDSPPQRPKPKLSTQNKTHQAQAPPKRPTRSLNLSKPARNATQQTTIKTLLSQSKPTALNLKMP